jgi:hypothetical protein
VVALDLKIPRSRVDDRAHVRANSVGHRRHLFRNGRIDAIGADHDGCGDRASERPALDNSALNASVRVTLELFQANTIGDVCA